MSFIPGPVTHFIRYQLSVTALEGRITLAIKSQVIPTAQRGKVSWLLEARLHLCYSSEGKDILAIKSQAIPLSVITLKRNVSWLSEAISITLKGKVSWLLEARVHLQHCSDGFPKECSSFARALAKLHSRERRSSPKPLSGDLLGGRNPEVWLPLLGWKRATPN